MTPYRRNDRGTSRLGGAAAPCWRSGLKPASGFIADEGEAVLGIDPIAFRLGKRESLLRGFPTSKEGFSCGFLKGFPAFPVDSLPHQSG
jgi:hypothetical protein